MAESGSAERVRRHRAREAGFEGRSSPITPEQVEAGLSSEEAKLALAWAEGVWQRQAEEESRRLFRKRSEFEAWLKKNPSERTSL